MAVQLRMVGKGAALNPGKASMPPGTESGMCPDCGRPVMVEPGVAKVTCGLCGAICYVVRVAQIAELAEKGWDANNPMEQAKDQLGHRETQTVSESDQIKEVNKSPTDKPSSAETESEPFEEYGQIYVNVKDADGNFLRKKWVSAAPAK